MAVRLAFLAAFILGGLVWWPIFLLAVMSAYALVSDMFETKKPEPDEWFARRWTTTGADPRWRSDFLKFCESPAETAFLNAMIDACGLLPNKGILQGGGLTLDLQVKLSNFRADFIAQGWLVIEVDGAAFHSSAEAIAKDRERDRFMEEQGYRVLRIPAKLVFSAPVDAVASVRAAVAAGRPARKAASAGERPTMGLVMNRVAFAAGELNDGLQRIKATHAAMAGPQMTFHKEQVAIDNAMDFARRAIEIKSFIGRDQAKRAAFDAHAARLNEAFKELDRDAGQGGSQARPSAEPFTIPVMVAPSEHYDVAVNEAIKRAYHHLMAERAEYLSRQRQYLQDDTRLRPLVKANLAELGSPQAYNLIASPA